MHKLHIKVASDTIKGHKQNTQGRIQLVSQIVKVVLILSPVTYITIIKV